MSPESTIYQELLQTAPTLLACKRDMPFQVPVGYFDQLPATILNRLTSITSASLGDVPAGYFEQLPNDVLHRIRQLEQDQQVQLEDPTLSPLLASLRGQMPYQVPEGYFSALQTHERLSQGKQMPYHIPDQYFEQLPHRVLTRVDETTTARVVAMKQRSFTRWMQAAAAVLVFALAGIGVYRYTQQPNATAGTIAVQPVKTLDAAILAGTKMSDADFEQQLKELDPVDVFSYLEKTSTEASIADLTAHVDEQKLPDPEQLLLDDQALNTFIQELESSSPQP